MASTTTTTAAGGAAGANNIDWGNVTMPNNCEQCGVQYDCIDDAHVSFCTICQDLFSDEEPDLTTAAGGTAGADDIHWGNDTMPSTCARCGVQYDCTEGAHVSLCDICHDLKGLFHDEGPENLVAGFQTPSETVAKAEKKSCEACGRFFSPSEKNNGVNCTRCCNGARKRLFSTISPGELSGLPQHILTPLCEEVVAARYSSTANAPSYTLSPVEAFEVLQSQPGALSAEQDDQLTAVDWHYGDDEEMIEDESEDESEDEETTEQSEPPAKRPKIGQE